MNLNQLSNHLILLSVTMHIVLSLSYQLFFKLHFFLLRLFSICIFLKRHFALYFVIECLFFTWRNYIRVKIVYL